MAKMTFSDFQMPEKGYLTIGEPACGAGSMVIQACAELKELVQCWPTWPTSSSRYFTFPPWSAKARPARPGT